MSGDHKLNIIRQLKDMLNYYTRECKRRSTIEQGKIIGAECMVQRVLDIIENDYDTQECEDKEC